MSVLKKENKTGLYGFWLNIDGAWREIIVDDQLPVFYDPESGVSNLAFSQTVQTQDLWVPLLEKAYAKSVGDYYSIAAGDPLHALNTLTGAPVERLNDFSNLDELWFYL